MVDPIVANGVDSVECSSRGLKYMQIQPPNKLPNKRNSIGDPKLGISHLLDWTFSKDHHIP